MLRICCYITLSAHNTPTHKMIFYVTFVFFPITITPFNHAKRVSHRMKKQSMLSIVSMASKTVSKVGVAGLIISVAMLSQTTNAANNAGTTIPLDMSGMNITKHEIAVMQVLSEICPPMLKGNQKQRFYKSYNTQLHELMPTLDDPKAAIQYLSTQQDYRQILQGMRSWTMSFSKQDNKELCEDMANAQF